MTKWNEKNRRKPRGSRCGAKTRSGKPCQKWAMANGRCRLHGGVVKPENNKHQFKEGNTKALVHGLYSNKLSKDEQEIYPLIEVGSIDNEIKMLQLMLRRIYKRARKMEDEGIECALSSEIIRFSRLIGILLMQRLQLKENKHDNKVLAERIRALEDTR